MPSRMPVVGYSGHLRRTKVTTARYATLFQHFLPIFFYPLPFSQESTVCYGTSYWRPTTPPSRQQATAIAYDKPWLLALALALAPALALALALALTLTLTVPITFALIFAPASPSVKLSPMPSPMPTLMSSPS